MDDNALRNINKKKNEILIYNVKLKSIQWTILLKKKEILVFCWKKNEN